MTTHSQLLDHNDEHYYYNDDVTIFEPFVLLCQRGFLKEAKKEVNILLQIKEEYQTYFENYYDSYILEQFRLAFLVSCLHGHLEVAKWLFELDHNNFDIQINRVFTNTCIKGQLVVAQWLFEMRPNIEISYDNEANFRFACYYGHLEVAQWLLAIKSDINISVLNDDAFIETCLSGQMDTALWLQTLNPYFYVIYYNEDGSYKGHYIRKKEEALWEQRKIPLWLASTNSPNKKSFIYKLPIDVSRLIIQNYL